MHGENFDMGSRSENELHLGTMISRVGLNEWNFLMPNLGDERKLAQS